MLLLVLAPISLLVWYVISYYRWVSKYPKGPTPLPFFGNLTQMHPQKIFETMAEFSKEHGSVFTVFMPKPNVIINDYELIKEAYLTRGDDFVDRPQEELSQILSYARNSGVINSVGQNWREQRRASLSIMRDFGMGKNLMEEQVKLSVLEYLKSLKNIKDKDRVDMRWHIQLMISNVICQTLFGFQYKYDDCEELVNYVEQLCAVLTEIVQTKLIFFVLVFPWIKHIPYLGYHAYWKHINNVKKMNQFIVKQVAKASKDYDPEAEPTCYVHGYRQRMPSNAYLTEDQLHACCADFFLAGQETTTTTLRWAMLHMANNIPIQEKLRNEIVSVVGNSRLPSMSDKPKMPYTMATILEIQRASNILAGNVQHHTTVDTEIKGMKIPANTTVTGDIHYLLGHDPVFKNPEEFKPERFLNEDGTSLNKETVERCIPFSIGKRQCAGEGLARVELFLGLTSTIQRYRILPPQDGTVNMTPIYNPIHIPQTNYLRLVPIE